MNDKQNRDVPDDTSESHCPRCAAIQFNLALVREQAEVMARMLDSAITAARQQSRCVRAIANAAFAKAPDWLYAEIMTAVGEAMLTDAEIELKAPHTPLNRENWAKLFDILAEARGADPDRAPGAKLSDRPAS